MTMKFECASCGKVQVVRQIGPDGDAGCVGPNDPPRGWRSIWTMIEAYTDDDGGMHRVAGEVTHSCDECNAHMGVDEHLEAETAGRVVAMRSFAKHEMKA